MAITIVDVQAYDIRFPTSRTLAGSDAMNNDPDYSAAYVVLQTDHPMGLEGHGLTFTIGRGNEVCVAAIRALAPLVIGRTLESFTGDMHAFWRHITGDSQLRWIGPEKGVIHLATGAVVNAVWDLWAKVEGKPLWKLLTDMTPGQIEELKHSKLPLEAKKEFAQRIVSDFHGGEEAKWARGHFESSARLRQQKGALTEDEILHENKPVVLHNAFGRKLPPLLVELGFFTSSSEAQRKIKEGAVYIAVPDTGDKRGWQRLDDPTWKFDAATYAGKKVLFRFGHRLVEAELTD